MSLAVVPKNKGDEEKIAQGLIKLMDEDKTFVLENNKETHQQILKGLGDQHIDVIVSKLKNKFGVDISFEEPKVPYRGDKEKGQGRGQAQEAVRRSRSVRSRFGLSSSRPIKKDLYLRKRSSAAAFRRATSRRSRKGLQESMQHGVLGGFPMVGLKATLVDGSYHDVGLVGDGV